MASDPLKMTFALLPDRRPPWKEFAFSYVTQSVLIALLVWMGTLRPLRITPPARDYRDMALVTTPPPVNHEPAPVREFKVPEPVAYRDTPLPDLARMMIEADIHRVVVVDADGRPVGIVRPLAVVQNQRSAADCRSDRAEARRCEISAHAHNIAVVRNACSSV